MTTVGKQPVIDADAGMTYFGYLSSIGQMPTAIRALIDRYHIRMYDEMSEWREPCELDLLPVNCSANNNDDDVEPAVHAPATAAAAAGQQTSSSSTGKVFKLRVPSLTRRLSKFGKRSSSDKNKAAGAGEVQHESVTSPSDSQLEAPVSAGTSMTTVDDCPDLQTPGPVTSTPLSDQQKSKLDGEQRGKHLDEQKDKCDAGNCHTDTQ